MRSYIESLEGLSRAQLVLMLARKHQEETGAVAVVGMGCRFPGGIDSPDEFWRALLDGRVVPEESTGPPTDSLGRPRWNTGAPDLAALADVLEKGSYLDAIDLFDAGYFGMPDEEAAHLDPQQRLLLMCAAEALADANLTSAELGRRRVGVFVGMSAVEYGLARLRNGPRTGGLSPHAATGGALSGAAGRVALAMGLNGPSMTVDTACASALTALHLACTALRRRECELAVVGASHLLLSPWSTAIFETTGVLSPSGRTRPFAADADGYVRGEGCGVLVLAMAGGGLPSTPYALVRGSAVDQQGERLAMTVLSGACQQRVITSALEHAGVDPASVAYVEAQANGSPLAGRVELEAIADAYRRRSPDAPPLRVGSCKANLGYLETASGMASLIKAVLAVGRAEIPPQVGVDELDPAAPWDRWSIEVPRKATPWPAGGRRIAGVSAAGFTGTCAHAVVEAAPEPESAPGEPASGSAPVESAPESAPVEPAPEPAPGPAPVGPDGPRGSWDGEPALLVLSAHTPTALRATAARLHAFLLARPDHCHTAVCRTLAVGRELRPVRHAAVVTDRETLLAQLAAAAAAADPQRNVGVPTSVTRAAGRPRAAPELRPGLAVEELQLVAEQLRGGARPRLAALWEHSGDGLYRLPPNAFDCRSYWPDEYRWS